MIEFWLDIGCAVKQALGEGRSVDAGHELARTSADGARLATALASSEGVDLERATVRLVRADAEGGERVEAVPFATFRRDVEARAARLEGLAHHCEGCPARALRRPFSCAGTIAYPIEAATEAALVDRLPPMLGTVGGDFLVRLIGERELDGARAARLRAEGRMFFERERPMHAHWRDAAGSYALSTDVLFEALFFAGPIDGARALVLALALGLAPHGVGPEELREALGDRDRLAELIEPVAVPRAFEGTQHGDVLHFLSALRRAVLLGVDLVVDA